MSRRIVIRHIFFTGAVVEPAGLHFDAGLNILYGASNTGKSFVVKALNFMFGGSAPLPGINERIDYDAVWLGVALPDGTEATLYRAASGGAFILYEGLVTAHPPGVDGVHLDSTHDAARQNNLSQFLLEAIGLGGKVVAKNKSGEKESFTFRGIAPYMFISEETIISERSPILNSGQRIRETAERNMFKVLLTGHDDSAVVTAINPKTRKIAREAKVDLIDELIAQVSAALGEMAASVDDLSAQAAALDVNLHGLHANLQEKQQRIDALVLRRRELADAHGSESAHRAELAVTLERFETLDALYASDLARLEAIEEGALVLAALTGQTCPVCGAPPECQLHTQGREQVEQYQRAAESESRKIVRERRDLRLTIASLAAEAEGLAKRLVAHEAERLKTEGELAELRPLEHGIRRSYEALLLKRAEVARLLDLHGQRGMLEDRRMQLENAPKGQTKGAHLEVGLDGGTLFAFSQTVKAVLEAWHFPGAEHVQFDAERQDIQIGGKPRGANGKGVRALLHAAFKVAVLVYCRGRGLPHPGIVVLDTPLLTYREPLPNGKYGELEADELAIKGTGLARHFYAHLAGLKDLGQIIVVENVDPPDFAVTVAKVEVFVGEGGVGRMGFF